MPAARRAPDRAGWSLIVASGWAWGAAAQTVPAAAPAAATEAPIQEVVVTGARIARADAETAVNVEVIYAAQIKESGQATVADYLRTIPSTFGLAPAWRRVLWQASNTPSPRRDQGAYFDKTILGRCS